MLDYIPVSEETIQFPSIRKLARAIAITAVILDGFYSPFMFQTGPAGFKAMFDQLGVDISDNTFKYIQAGAIPFVLCNLINDWSSVDPLREADELVLNYIKHTSVSQKKNKTHIVNLILSLMIKTAAVLYSYPIGASADGLPTVDWFNHWFGKNSSEAEVLRYMSLSIFATFLTVYYMMFLNGRISNHVSALIETMKSLPDFMKFAGKNFFTMVEVMMQVTANACNRGVSFTFIMSTGLKEYIDVPKHKPVSKNLAISAGVNSAFLTYFTRLLSVYNKLFNKEFSSISDLEYKQASGFNLGFVVDAFFGAIRGGSIGLLIYQLIQPSAWSYLAAPTLGGLITAHSLSVHYQFRRKENAIIRRKNQTPLGENSALLTEEHESVDISDVECLDELPVTERIKSKFEALASQQNSRPLRSASGLVVHATQILRLFAFFMFVETFDEIILGNRFSPLTLFALTLLWGCEVYKNNAALYQEAITETWTGMAAKWQMETNEQATVAVTPSRCQGTLFNKTLKVISKGPYDYSEEQYDEALNPGH